MFLRILITFSLLVWFSFGVQVAYREGNYPDKKRLVLQFERGVEYRVLLLDNPKRIVVDVMERVEVPKNIKARVGYHPWGTRFVFDMNYSEVKAFSLEAPFRIVLDVYRATANPPQEDSFAKEKSPRDKLVEQSFTNQNPTYQRGAPDKIEEKYYQLLVQSFLGANDPQNALRVLEDAVRRFPQNPKWWELYGQVLLWNNMGAKAGEAFYEGYKNTKIKNLPKKPLKSPSPLTG